MEVLALVEEKDSLDEANLEVVCGSTLLIQGEVDVTAESLVSYDIIGDIYILTYENIEDAMIAYTKFTEDERVEFCEFDILIGTQTEEKVIIEDANGLPTGRNYNGGDVVVALLDTGVSGNYENSYNAFDGSSDVRDTNGHGTYMEELILANSNATLIPIKVIGENGVGTVSEVLKGLAYATEKNVNIINMSFVTTYGASSQILASYIQELSQTGIYIVASAGNDSNNVMYYTPANIEEVIVVGAATMEGTKQDFSNFGSTVDFYVSSDSTSEAAALTTALIASSLNSGKQPEYILQNTTGWYVDNWTVEDYPEYIPEDAMGELTWNIVYEAYATTKSPLGGAGSSYYLKSAVPIDHSVNTGITTHYISGTASVYANQASGYDSYGMCYAKVDGSWYVHLKGTRTDNGASSTGWFNENLVIASAGLNTYTYTFNANGGSVSPTSITFTVGDTITYPTPTRTGYTFTGWMSATTGSITAAGAVNTSSATGDRTMIAQWSANTVNTYTVKFNGNGSTTGSMNSLTYNQDTWYTLPSSSFVKQHTVTYNANGGTVSKSSETVSSTFAGWTPSYTMVNNGTSYSSSVFNAAFYANLYSDLMRVYGYDATSLLSHYVTYIVNGSETRIGVNNGNFSSGYNVYPDSASVKNLTSAGGTATLLATWSYGIITLPTPTRTGYTFNYWLCSNGAIIYPGGQAVIGGDLSFTAQWTANTYTVSYDANGGSGAPSSQTKTYGKTLTLRTTEPTRTGYTFLGWSKSSTATSATWVAGGSMSTTAITADTKLYAVWEINTYTVTFKNPHYSYTTSSWSWALGTPTSKVITVNHGTVVDAMDYIGYFTAETGYTLNTTTDIDWWEYTSSVSQIDYTTYTTNGNSSKFTVAGNMVVQFHSHQNRYSVSYDANTTDVVTNMPSAQVKNHGEDLTLSDMIPERDGYIFIGWNTSASGDGTFYEPGEVTTYDDIHILYAQWDGAPELTVADVYMYIENEIDDSRFYRDVLAIDKEDGDITEKVTFNQEEVESELEKIRVIEINQDMEYQIEVEYKVIDEVGNEVTEKAILYVYAVYDDMYEMALKSQWYIRFISADYI